MQGLLKAGGGLLVLVGIVALFSMLDQPGPADMDRWVREGKASRTQVRVLNHTVWDQQGNLLLDCKAGINRLPAELKDHYSCETLTSEP